MLKQQLVTGGAGHIDRMPLILSTRRAPALVHMSAYANSFNALIPQLYEAMDIVSREMVGYIPSVMRAPAMARAAVGQTVSYPIAPVQVARDVVPQMQVPNPPDNTIGTGLMAITKSREVPFGITGEEQRGMNTGGVGWNSAQAMLIAQGIRTLVNEMELDIAVEAAANASRAIGTPGTPPFQAGVGDSAFLRKILDDNGAPLSGRSMIINSTSGAYLRTNTQLTKANEAGTALTLRTGELLDLHGFSVKETGQAVTNVKGTTNGAATTNAAGYAIGATVITLANAGTGSILPGNVVAFAGDANKYQVIPTGGDVDTSNGGTITIAAPGLRQAIPAAATLITVSNTYAANVGFSADALHFATRAPALPEEGDLAMDRIVLTDPRSGISFEFTIWPGMRMVEYTVAAAWGVKATKREHIALLMG